MLLARFCFHPQPMLFGTWQFRSCVYFNLEVFGETIVGAAQSGTQLLLEELRKKCSFENAGLSLGNAADVDANQVVGKDLTAGNAVTFCLYFIEYSKADLGDLRQLLRDLRGPEGRFEDGASEFLDPFRDCHAITS